jgi:hypothetical protein
MPTDYQAIASENIAKYGTEINNYGPILLAHLYSDRTHFIYELLQNAEDAYAWRLRHPPSNDIPRTIKFTLLNDHLQVAHFGLPFNEQHVRGICGLAQGTKRDDLNAIGKFGIGFKSVYAYTLHPEIHSGEEHFVIESFVRPQSIAPRDAQPDETLFYLPFDNPEVSQEKASAEIEDRLIKLDCRTLLFLNHIQSIEWIIPNMKAGSYTRKVRRIDEQRKYVTLASQVNGKISSEEWLVFERPAIVPNQQQVGKVEIAYKIEEDEKTGQKQIIPISDSNLYVFFATEKETHLGFLVQGPYRTTPSRDNIPKDDEWNIKLVEETAILLRESLIKLREMKLLTVNALKAMPLNRMQFSEDHMFHLLFESVRDALAYEALIPRYEGNFVSGTNAKIANSADLRQLLGPSQLEFFYDAKSPLSWVTDEISEYKTPELREYLMKELGVEEFTSQTLASKFTERFIANQSDEWMINFYKYLLDQRALWSKGGVLRKKPFIRLEDGTHVPPFDDQDRPNAFLPGDSPTDFPTVKRTICQNEHALDFLNKLGLKKPDIVDDVIQHVLPKYSQENTKTISDEIYRDDISRILNAHNTDSRQRRDELITKLKASYFVRCRNAVNNEIRFYDPKKVYFPTELLMQFFEGNSEIWFLDEELPIMKDEKVAEMLGECGANKTLKRIAKELSWEEREEIRKQVGVDWNAKKQEVYDYTIEGLPEFLAKLNDDTFDSGKQKSILLWNLLCEVVDGFREYGREGYFQGAFIWQHYSKYTRHFDAHFLLQLRQVSWLPAHDGTLKRPSEICFSELPEDFKPQHYLQSKLGFKPEAINLLAKEANIDPAILDFIRNNNVSLEQLRRHFEPAQETRESFMTGMKYTTKPSGESGVGIPQKSSSAMQGNSKVDNSSLVEPLDRTNDENGEPKTARTDINQPNDRSRPFKTYVYVSPKDTNEVADSASVENRIAVDNAGIKRVLEFERQSRRFPEQKSHSYPGYDIESKDIADQVVRYIEVKSVSGSWGEQGVTLSKTQFQKAIELGDRYWLYVVERAAQDDFQIHCLQNPACQVHQFVYDNGWKALAEENGEHVKSDLNSGISQT